jgi:hypothetical protein
MQKEMEEGIRMARKERDIIAHSRLAIVVNLMFYYGLAISVWGLVLRFSIFWSAVAGIILGLIIAFTFCLSTITTKPRNIEEVEDRNFFVRTWCVPAIVIGVFGLLFWGAKVFFSQ